MKEPNFNSLYTCNFSKSFQLFLIYICVFEKTGHKISTVVTKKSFLTIYTYKNNKVSQLNIYIYPLTSGQSNYWRVHLRNFRVEMLKVTLIN